MMRVLLDYRMTAGGVGRYGADLIATLGRMDDVVDLEVMTRPAGPLRSLSAPFTPWGRLSVASASRRKRVDLIHGLHLEVPHVRIPSVVTIPDLIPLQMEASMPSLVRRAVYGRMVRASADRARAVITHASVTRRALVEFGVDENKVEVIPHGVSGSFSPLSETETDTARARFAGGGRYVASIATSKAHKGSEMLERLAPRLHDLGLALVVRGPSSESYRSVPFLRDEDLRLFCGGAEAFVLASRLEGFGLPALEAAACGVPVVVHARTGVSEYLSAAGVIVADYGADGFVEGVASVTSTAARPGYVSAALDAARRLTTERMAQATVEVYRRAIA